MITKEEYNEIESMLDSAPDDHTRAQAEAYVFGIRDCVLGGDKDFFVDKLKKVLR